MPKNQGWFRFYERMPDSPQILELDDTEFRVLVCLWCLASSSGEDGLIPHTPRAISRRYAFPYDTLTTCLRHLCELDLLSQEGEHFRVNRWAKHQYVYASHTPEMRREQKQKERERTGETAPETGGNEPVVNGRKNVARMSQESSKPVATQIQIQNQIQNQKKQASAGARAREEPADDPPPTTPACLPANDDISISSNGRTPLPVNGLKHWRERLADEPEHWTPEEIRTVETVVTHVRGDPEPKQPLRYYLPLLHDLRAGTLDAGQVEAARDYLASRERMGLR